MNPKTKNLVVDITRPQSRAVRFSAGNSRRYIVQHSQTHNKPQRPKQYISEVILSQASKTAKNYARFYRTEPAKKVSKISDNTQNHAVVAEPLAHQAVKRSSFREGNSTNSTQDYLSVKLKSEEAPKKPKSVVRRLSQHKKDLANFSVAAAVLMSLVLGFMAYRYHLALQKVEAKPMQANINDVENAEAQSSEVIESDSPGIAKLTESAVKSSAVARDGSLPYKLTIPKLGVNGYFVQVGINKQGALAVPSNIWQVGWAKSSAKPKDNSGVVVVNGHVHGPTKPGIFANLHKLVAGDLVSIIDSGGTKYSYKVVTTKNYKAGETGPELYESVSADKQGLNLITCSGKIVNDEYQERTIVFAEKV